MSATQILPPPVKKKGPSFWAVGGAFIGIAVAFAGWWAASHREPAAPPPVPAPARQEVQVVPAPPPGVKEDGVLTNESIVAMARAKVPDAVIIGQVRGAIKTKFDLSTAEVIRLTGAGVSSAVLEVMRRPAAVPQAKPEVPPAAVPATPPAAVEAALPERTIVLSDGLPVELSLAAGVPNDPEPGTPLKFVVKRDFLVNGVTAIPAGATVTGEVSGVKKGLLGRGAKPTFRLFAVDAAEGSKIALRAAPGKSGDKAERVIEPPGRRDKSVLAPAGTEYMGYVDGNQTVVVRR